MNIKKAVLIEPLSETHFFSRSKMPLLGLPILGSILRRMNIDVKIFCENLAPIDWKDVSEADIVGISVLTRLAPRAYELGLRAKQLNPGVVIIMGGPHVTFMPEEAIEKGADYVVRYEGEKTLPMLINHLCGEEPRDIEEIPGLCYSLIGVVKINPGRIIIEDLDQIPRPDFSLITGSENINFVPVQTSRGCPYDCEFCSVVEMFGRRIRYRSPEVVVDDFLEIQETHPKHVFIVDDNFSANRERAINLLETMRNKGVDLEWSTQERVSIAEDVRVLRLMRDAGCNRLYQGIESFNPSVLKEWGKGQTPEEIEKSISVIHGEGMLIHGMFILGGDNDTAQTIQETIRSAIRLGLDTAQFFALVPLPGTPLFERFEKEGRIIDRNWERYDGQSVVFEPRNISPWHLQEFTVFAYKKFYTYLRALRWASRGKLNNAFLAIYGKYIFQKWLKENRQHLASLKSRWDSLITE